MAGNPPLSREDVKKAVTFLRYPEPSDEYLDYLEDLIGNRPAIYDVDYLPCYRWLTRLKIMDLVKERSGIKEAAELLQNQDIRAKLEVLLCGEVEIEDIALFLSSRFGTDILPHEVQYFQHLFWNPKKMDFDSWDAFLPGYWNVKSIEDVAYTKDSESAKFISRMTDFVDSTKSLQWMMSASHVKAQAIMARGASSREDLRYLKVLSDNLMRAIYLLDKDKSVEERAIRALEELQIMSADRRIFTVKQLQEDGRNIVHTDKFLGPAVT